MTSIAEQVAVLLSYDYWRTAPLAEVRQATTQQGYAASKLELAREIVTLVLNGATLHERLYAAQVELARKDAA